LGLGSGLGSGSGSGLGLGSGLGFGLTRRGLVLEVRRAVRPELRGEVAALRGAQREDGGLVRFKVRVRLGLGVGVGLGLERMAASGRATQTAESW